MFVFPHFLFSSKKREPEVLTDDMLVKIHSDILDSVHDMQRDRATREQIINHIDRVNSIMRNKWGDNWVDFPTIY